jgi:myo-inositol-1(or 4)-monophosphatase
MLRDADWLQVLDQCRREVRNRIRPLLASSRQPQPYLGVGAGGDPIKKIDLAAEEAIVDTLRKHETSFTLISEESGVKEFGEHPDTCYVAADPVDGTTNLTRGIPFYATSIAVSDEPILSSVHTAIVTDLFHEVTYTARRGRGAHRNNRRISPSENRSLDEAVVGIDLNSYMAEKTASRLTNLIDRIKHVRHFGANALELCYVADGTTDGFIDIRGKLRTTDVAAGWLIAGEAGAQLTLLGQKGSSVKLSPKQRMKFVASGNREIHAMILELIEDRKGRE